MFPYKVISLSLSFSGLDGSSTCFFSPVLSLSLCLPWQTAVWMDVCRAGRGRGLPKNVAGLFLLRLHSLPSLHAPATWGCHMAIRQGDWDLWLKSTTPQVWAIVTEWGGEYWWRARDSEVMGLACPHCPGSDSQKGKFDPSEKLWQELRSGIT
jgi:hypothetical protein